MGSANSDAERLKVFLEDQHENLVEISKNLIATLNPPDSVIREVHAQLADQLDDIPEIVSAVVHGSHK